MKKLACVFACMMSLMAAAAMAMPASPPVQADKAADAEYAALLARVKAGDTNIDFDALRMAYTKTPGFNGYGHFDQKAAFEALNAGKFADALKMAEDRLAESYMDIGAHMAASMAQDKLGHSEQAAFEHRVAQGMLTAIFRSGDGFSAKTAYKVINVPEEYIVLGLRHLKLTRQSLITEGGAFDLMSTTDASGAKLDLWFDISSFYGKGIF